jgi:hypothetical protein
MYAFRYALSAMLLHQQNYCADVTMAMLKTVPEDYFSKTVSPWVGIIEHNAEHYGLLVGYYRFNGLVPPESRKTKSE